MMPGPRRQLAVAHRTQVAAQGLLAHRHAVFVKQPLDQVDDPPAHHPMRGRDRASFDNLGQRPLVLGTKYRARARRLAVQQPIRALDIEPQNPVPNRLQTNAANPRRFVPCPTIVNYRQRQQPSNLVRVPAQSRQSSKASPVKIVPKPNRRRHRNPPKAHDVESDYHQIGNPPKSQKPRALV